MEFERNFFGRIATTAFLVSRGTFWFKNIEKFVNSLQLPDFQRKSFVNVVETIVSNQGTIWVFKNVNMFTPKWPIPEKKSRLTDFYALLRAIKLRRKITEDAQGRCDFFRRKGLNVSMKNCAKVEQNNCTFFKCSFWVFRPISDLVQGKTKKNYRMLFC